MWSSATRVPQRKQTSAMSRLPPTNKDAHHRWMADPLRLGLETTDEPVHHDGIRVSAEFHLAPPDPTPRFIAFGVQVTLLLFTESTHQGTETVTVTLTAGLEGG